MPTGLRLSHDKKTIFVTTNDHSGVEVIDVATRKVTNHFVLNTATHRYRFNGGAPDPEGKFLYATTTEIIKQADRFEIGKPKYTVIDLAQQKIVKTVDSVSGARRHSRMRGGGNGRRRFEVSPDGKYLYQFAQSGRRAEIVRLQCRGADRPRPPRRSERRQLASAGFRRLSASPASASLSSTSPTRSCTTGVRAGSLRPEHPQVRFHADRSGACCP